MQLVNLLSNTILVCLALSVSGDEKEVAILRAVRGREARLPCGPSKVFLDGPDSYVIWLKNDREFRYRYPVSSEKRIATRHYLYDTSCESGFCHEDTSLIIKKPTDKDEGLYRCRIHYQASPSVDFVIDFKLVESPGFPRIYTSDGDRLKNGFIGPLTLDSDVDLVCLVDTKPNELNTTLMWHRDGVLVNQTSMSHPGRTLRVDTSLRKLSRGDLNAHYECLAQNADVTEPLVASVYIKMYLPPITVEIRMNNNYNFEAGQPRVVDCVVVGCIPPPIINWKIGTRTVRPSVHKELHDGNYTISSLSLAPFLEDDDKELVCMVHNTFIPYKTFQDKVTINVGSRPTCHSCTERIGAVDQQTETVECIVESSSAPVQFSWTFANSKTVYTRFTKVREYPNRYISTLSWVAQKGDIGLLHCRATNAQGEQKNPCTVIVSAGGPPDMPDCKVQRICPDSLRVQCEKGWDGGRPQTIHLDIVDKDGVRTKNLANNTGHFYVRNIVDEFNQTVVLYASNTRGKSKKKVLYLHTLPMISEEVETKSNENKSDWRPYIEAFSGLVGVAIVATVVKIIIKTLVARHASNETNLDIASQPDGCYHREPDFSREERRIGSTNITVNQSAPCQNTYSSSHLPTCRLMGGHEPLPRPEGRSSSQHSYYV